MLSYLLVFSSQVAFNIFKVLEIRYTYENKLNRLLINSIFINLVSLVGIYYSLDALLNKNFIVILFYLGGSVLGKYIGMKYDNPLSTLWQKVQQKSKFFKVTKVKVRFKTTSNV